MKRKTSLVIFGMVLSVLLGTSLVGMQPGYAYMSDECEINRFNAFMNALNPYRTKFRSWYFGDPITCSTECTNQCNALPTQQERNACLASLPSCISNCDTARYNSFSSAQDDMIAVANQSCPLNLDFCAQARALRDSCVANFMWQMENPVLDGNGEVDVTWADTVITEYMSCRSASGVDFCE